MWIGLGAGAGACFGRRDRLTVLRIRAPGCCGEVSSGYETPVGRRKPGEPCGRSCRDYGHQEHLRVAAKDLLVESAMDVVEKCRQIELEWRSGRLGMPPETRAHDLRALVGG